MAVLSNHLSLLSRVIQIGHMTVTLIIGDFSFKLLAPRGYSILCVVELKEVCEDAQGVQDAPPAMLGPLLGKTLTEVY